MENYSKMFQSNTDATADSTVEEVWQMSTTADATISDPEYTITTTADAVIEEVFVVEEPKPIIGVVVNCTKLNVRERPIAGAAVVCTLVALDEVQIEEEESTDEFYKICTVSGLEGFCMKKYIVIREE